MGLARALAVEPQVLLMDEPFSAVDEQTRRLLQEELLAIWERTRLTVIFITHSMEEAVLLGDRVVLMSARPGRISEIVAVPLPRPRSSDVGRVERSSEYVEITARLWERLRDMTVSGRILGNLVTSLGNLALGFGISLAAGLVIGTAMGRYRRVRAALGIYVYALLTAPSLVFAPVFFSILGAGRASIIGVIFMYSAFVMIITTASAVEKVPEPLLEMGRYPNLKVITHHMGAMIPFLEGRIRLGWADQFGSRTDDPSYRSIVAGLRHEPVHYFRQFYADTALSGSAIGTRCGFDFFGAERVVFASDCPFDPEGGPMYIREMIKVIHELDIGPAERERIYAGNMRSLLRLDR